MCAHPSDGITPELLRAAANVPSSDPGYAAVTYHRLRLMPRDSAARDQLLAVLPTNPAAREYLDPQSIHRLELRIRPRPSTHGSPPLAAFPPANRAS